MNETKGPAEPTITYSPGNSLSDSVMGRGQAKNRFGTGLAPAKGRPSSGASNAQTTPARKYGDDRGMAWGQSAEIVRRSVKPDYTFEGMRPDGKGGPGTFMRRMQRISPIMAQSLRLMKRLANTGVTVEVKKKDEKTGKFTIMDDEAVKVVNQGFSRAGERVISDVPGACGSMASLIDTFIEHGVTSGSICGELVLKPNRRDVFSIVDVDPNTIEFRRDLSIPGVYKIGQRRIDVSNGWLELNPNLVTYRQLNGFLEGPYGTEEYETAEHVTPLWMGYFSKLALFLQRAAFGFLDGEVSTETLLEMWKSVDEDVKQSFDHDALAWMDSVAQFLATSYAEQQAGDPDAMAAHLDLLKVKGEASGKASFPLEGAKVIRQELYAAIGTPGELLGEASNPSDQFSQMKIEGYHAYLRWFQDNIAEILKRMGFVILWAQAWPHEVEVTVKFNPIPIDDRLTTAQAQQLEIIIARMLRDENLISQNELGRRTTGVPAVGPAPMSGGSDPDGPSAPDIEYLASRNAADQQQKGHASGTANQPTDGKVGGTDKQRKTDPSADKKT